MFWMLLADEELLLPFAQFQWFRRVTIEQLTHVEWPTPEHRYWPELDIAFLLRRSVDRMRFLWFRQAKEDQSRDCPRQALLIEPL